MENAIWLFVVAGGAAALGLALAFGLLKQNPRRNMGPIAGALIVAVGAVGLAYLVKEAPSTAPSNPATPAGGSI